MFSGNTNDGVGTNNATIVGTDVTLTTDRFNNSNNAYYFSGVHGNYMTVNAYNPLAKSFSVSLWFNSGTSNNAGIFSNSYYPSGISSAYGFTIHKSSNQKVHGELRGDNGVGRHATNDITSNQWHHVVLVFDEDKLLSTMAPGIATLYQNGVLVGTSMHATQSVGDVVNSHLTAIGAYPFNENDAQNPFSGFFHGKIDDIMIYNRALDSTEVVALFNAPNPTATQYTITTSANPSAGGTVTGAGSHNDGTTVTLTATANANYEFVKWTENGNDVSTNNPYTFTASANRILVAQFQEIVGVNNANAVVLGIYPNPANTILNIVSKENTKIKIVDVLGKAISTQTLSTGTNSIDVSNFTKGVYFVQAGNSVVKFIKE